LGSIDTSYYVRTYIYARGNIITILRHIFLRNKQIPFYIDILIEMYRFYILIAIECIFLVTIDNTLKVDLIFMLLSVLII